jgi:DtxR family Mn-dependent transcriptional regulator
MKGKMREKEEYLEGLWELKEDGHDSIDDLEKALGGNYGALVVEELALEGLVELSAEKTRITLTERGENEARKIIRAHRIGERLIYDVFGGEFETAACEFEHTITDELVDGICTLLGHPRECPHGMSIPEGECCRSSARTAYKQVIPLKELKIGQSARVAYINSRDDRQMHKLDGLQVRPRATVKLHQQYPCYVIECEGAHIAMDEAMVSNICVWANNGQFQPGDRKPLELDRKRRSWWGSGLLFGRKRQGPPCCDIKGRSSK